MVHHLEINARKPGLLGKEMATHSSILAWKNPWTEESGRLKDYMTEHVCTRVEGDELVAINW